MSITLITPTADQPHGIALLERYIARQTVPPDQWIVVDDGEKHAELTMGQQHIMRDRHQEGPQSLACNLMTAIPLVTSDLVMIVEHDDYYTPNHIEICLQRLSVSQVQATGCRNLRYYHVGRRVWIVMRNRGSALCNTALRAECLPFLLDAATRAFAEKSRGIDNYFWESVQRLGKVDLHDQATVVGIKGLPGRVGLGIGHHPDRRRPWRQDLALKQLRSWIGADADRYAGFSMRRISHAS